MTNQEQPKSIFAQRNRETERFQRQLTTNQTNSTRTGQLYNKGSLFHGTIPFHTSGFSPSNSCSTAISERFSYHLDRELRSIWDFFIKAKDFFFSSILSLTFVRLGIFSKYFFSGDSSRWETHTATCSRTCGGRNLCENVEWLIFGYGLGYWVIYYVSTGISFGIHPDSLSCQCLNRIAQLRREWCHQCFEKMIVYYRCCLEFDLLLLFFRGWFSWSAIDYARVH